MVIREPRFNIDAQVYEAVKAYREPKILDFGRVMAPVMFRADYRHGNWSVGELLPYGPISIYPSAKVLHYGHEFFEGLKAYRVGSERANLFRPLNNWQRMNQSARRLCMPEIPQALFMDGVQAVTVALESIIPRGIGQSLYLRPFVIGTEADMGLSRSESCAFFVIASPSEAIHSGSMKVLIEREYSRVAYGGTGAAKVGGNYAAALESTRRVREAGFDQTLWLDPLRRCDIEELSGMNFFALIDGVLMTPALSGSILPGITRDSIITLARHLGHRVEEVTLPVDDLIAAIKEGRCGEAFSCGTAALIAPIACLGDSDGSCYAFKHTLGPVTKTLGDHLVAIQERRAEDPFGWVYGIPECFYPAMATPQAQ